jgi:hypothetical protein
MKKTVFLIISVLICFTLSAQKAKARYNPKGKWKFENSYAPAGYSEGIVEIKHAKKKYSVSFLFSGNPEVFLAEDVKFKNDSLQFSLNIMGMAMSCKSRFEHKDKITGQTFVMGTSVPFELERDKSHK